MNTRFADLKKIPKEPAARMLAMANAKLTVPLKAPASAPVAAVLNELDDAGALTDMLRLLSVALPPRERVWWACLAARDLLGEGADAPETLVAAEKWVFKPGDDTREAARLALESAETDDDTALCATAVVFFDGTLGPGDMAQYPAPPGASQVAAFAINVMALAAGGREFAPAANRLIDRALDIARGGSGRIDAAPTNGGAT